MFWNGKRVLVTGHTGFKGGWLSLWLQRLGADVVGYALPPPTTPSLYEAARVGDGMESVEGDVRDLERVRDVVRRHRPEVVFHLAAQPQVRYSYAHPVETYAVNVMGTVNVLEAVRQEGGVRSVVAVTTDKCYENREWVWGYRETDPMGGHDPYSNSKGCSELVVAAYRQSYFADEGPALASARAGNVIGGGDWSADRLVPDAVRAFGEGRRLQIRSPHATRPWQHVLEPLDGYLTLAERLWDGDPRYAAGWNFGPQDADAQPVAHVVDRLTQLWDGAAWELDGDGGHPHEATYLKLDCSKARARLGWTPRLDLATALAWTAEWYLGHLHGEDMLALTHRQIERYESLTAETTGEELHAV